MCVGGTGLRPACGLPICPTDGQAAQGFDLQANLTLFNGPAAGPLKTVLLRSVSFCGSESVHIKMRYRHIRKSRTAWQWNALSADIHVLGSYSETLLRHRGFVENPHATG